MNMKNWSLVRIVIAIIAWISLVCVAGLLWLFRLFETERAIATSEDVYILMEFHWAAAFVLALILPPVALLIFWLLSRRPG